MDIHSDVKCSLFGAVIGYIYFLCELESSMMKNVIWRNGRLNICNIFHYMKNPFLENHLWHRQLLGLNWIFTSFVGALVGYGSYHIISLIMKLYYM
jgi:hypothetical protein